MLEGGFPFGLLLHVPFMPVTYALPFILNKGFSLWLHNMDPICGANGMEQHECTEFYWNISV
jgi:hypothetical protein